MRHSVPSFLLCILGAKVYIACRDSALGKAAQSTLRQESRNKEVHYLPIKLGSLDDLKSFVEGFKQSKLFLFYYVTLLISIISYYTMPLSGGQNPWNSLENQNPEKMSRI